MDTRNNNKNRSYRNYLSRKPDYSNGRFFISPFLGCPAKCMYCYAYNCQEYREVIGENHFSVDETINYLTNHPLFKQGKNGSIISVGAWGDPFSSKKATNITLRFLEKLCALGTPIQICSKFSVDTTTISQIADFIRYENQLLYSTSIVSFKYWKVLEPFAISPDDRIDVLNKFQEKNIPTNIMVKPFIFGLTNKEIEIIKAKMIRSDIKYCVLGVFYWNDQIITEISGRFFSLLQDNNFSNELSLEHKLMCSKDKKYFTFDGKLLDEFCKSLRESGISVFKNATCVTANLLKVPHISQLYKDDPLNLCIKCGNCVDESEQSLPNNRIHLDRKQRGGFSNVEPLL